MNRIMFVALVAAACFLSCDRDQGLPGISGARLSADLPVSTGDSSFVIHRAYDIYHMGRLVMYKFEYDHDSLFNGHLVTHETRPVYFVFDKDSAYGYPYYSIHDALMPRGRMLCDSIFRANAFSPFNFDSLFGKRAEDSIYVDRLDNLVKVFVVDSSEEYPESSFYYLYYSKKFAGIGDSFFSKSGKDEKNLQLFKIRIVAKGHFYPQYKIMLPKREAVYEMSEISKLDTTTLQAYFKRYKLEARNQRE